MPWECKTLLSAQQWCKVQTVHLRLHLSASFQRFCVCFYLWQHKSTQMLGKWFCFVFLFIFAMMPTYSAELMKWEEFFNSHGLWGKTITLSHGSSLLSKHPRPFWVTFSPAHPKYHVWVLKYFVVVQSLIPVWLCKPVGCSTPGFPVLHYLQELAQTHVHWVDDAIQPSHPLSPASPPAFNLSQHQGLFQELSQLFASGGQIYTGVFKEPQT